MLPAAPAGRVGRESLRTDLGRVLRGSGMEPMMERTGWGLGSGVDRKTARRSVLLPSSLGDMNTQLPGRYA